MSKVKSTEMSAQLPVDGIAGARVEALRARQKAIFRLLDQIDAEMKDAVELDDAARERSHRLRGQGEKEALASVLDFADARPEPFADLGTHDNGRDPAVFETALLRDRLEGALILGEIVDRVEATKLKLSDSALYLTSLVKPVTLAAYEIAKPIARLDRKNGQKLNGALNYYGAIGRAGAKTRAQKQPAPEK